MGFLYCYVTLAVPDRNCMVLILERAKSRTFLFIQSIVDFSMKNRMTSKSVARKASGLLRASVTKTVKAVAGSALSQRAPKRATRK